MKTYSKYLMALVIATSAIVANCGDPGSDKKIGKAGDHFDLFAVMHLVEKSSSPEALERSLNDKSIGVNNLDLNSDGQTDYLRVEDKVVDGAHVLVLQVPVESGNAQDIAVIEINKTGENQASIQIIGDEDLYGKDYIVEPKSNKNEAGLIIATTAVVNVWYWPFVTFIYSPAYIVWISPYYYEYYPIWWDPWPVVAFEVYSPMFVTYHTYYQFSDGYRHVHVHEKYYSSYRTTTRFSYTSKDYGKVTIDADKPKGGDARSPGSDRKDGSSGDEGKSPGRDDKGGGKDVKSPSDKKPDAKQPRDNVGGDKKSPQPKSPGGADKKSPQPKSPGGVDKKSPATQPQKSPDRKQNIKQPAPKSNPSQGGKPQSGKPGGKK